MTSPISLGTGRVARAAAVAAFGALAACAKDPDVVAPDAPPSAAPWMARYVALGNSITAGYQSGGINDSTQRRSYAAVIARAAGTRFAYPSLGGRGCAPPIVDAVSGVRVGGDTSSTTCDLRAESSFTGLLNNVAVPGANSFSPLGLPAAPAPTPGGAYSPLTQFILGGRTQVQKAIELDPTFATVWIGNIDVLGFALAGTRVGVTDSAAFIANYARTIDTLRAGSPHLEKGVLIGVVNVVDAPLGVPISVINPSATPSQPSFAYQPLANAAVRFLFARPIAFAPNCNAGTPQIAFTVLLQLAAAANATLPPAVPFTFVCADVAGAAPKTPGLLTDADRTFFINRVRGWNAYIRAKADSIGWVYHDPNARLDVWRATGQIPPFPNLLAPTAPFAPFISNDGIHPSTQAHLVLAQDIIAAINATYGSSIPSPTTNP
jgi:hypothetical protein